MPQILFYKEGREILRFPLTHSGSQFRLGRHPSNDITIPDQEISRFHSTIERRDGIHWLVDQSRNGTFYKGKKISSTPLSEGDEFQLGSWTLKYLNDQQDSEQETLVSKKIRTPSTFQGMIGSTEPMKKLFAMIEKVAPTNNTVLVLGETGTGKELVSKSIHNLSPRERKPFVALNCGAISANLIESELFGHERGAFTGALQRHYGAFEQARGGTLFLDEVGELPLELQPKLLRVLEERKFRRVGGTDEVEADVRVVAATHRQLEQQVKEGRFREDLFYRLYAVPLFIPPLRERKEDIPLMVNYFLEILQSQVKHPKTFSQEALEKLKSYSWKGNVRELRNVLTRSILFAETDVLQASDILLIQETDSSESRPMLENMEKDAIESALRECNWNKTKAAEKLGIAKSTLFNKLKEYDIQKP